MAVEKKECYRVVTIQFLKDFCDGIIAPKETKGLTYCPTYKELTTNGSIISTWKAGTTPDLDRAGIVVNSTSLATSEAYTDNQCVDQKDISVRYTTYDGITVSASPTIISECSGNTTLSYNKDWTRYTKAITSCTESNYSTKTTSSKVTDTTSGGVTWAVSPTSGTSLNDNVLTLAKNPTTSSRDYYVTGSYSGITSSSIKITQNKLTWDWVQSGTPITRYDVSAYRISPIGGIITECSGGTYSANGTCITTITTNYVYQDSCGSVSGNPSATTVSTINPLPVQKGSFEACDGTDSKTALLTFNCGGKSAMVTFMHDCSNCLPPICDFIYVDSGHADTVPSSGATGNDICDSAFINTVKYTDLTDDNIEMIIEPHSASGWVSFNINHWDIDPRDSDHFCSPYDVFPCVAESVMRHGGVPENAKKPEVCGGEAGVPMPDVVTKAIALQNNYDHALSTIQYTVSPNTNAKERSCNIKFAVKKDGITYPCSTYEFTLNQLGTASTCVGSVHKISSTIPSIGGTNALVGTYTISGTCSSNWYATSYPNWMSNVTFSNGNIYADIQQNTSTSNSRSGWVETTLEGYGNDRFIVTQDKSSVTNYAYIIYSNIEGAKVHFDFGTNIYITNGMAVFYTTANTTYNVEISSPDCIFSPSSSGTVSPTSAATFYGSCVASDMTITTVLVNNSLSTINFNRLLFMLNDGYSVVATATSPGYTLSPGQSSSFTFTISSAYRGTRYDSMSVYNASSSKVYSTNCNNGTITDATIRTCTIG